MGSHVYEDHVLNDRYSRHRDAFSDMVGSIVCPMLFYYKFLFIYLREIKLKQLGLQPINIQKYIKIGNNINRIITHLTEIIYKKEIAIPYLLHICATEGMSYEDLSCVCFTLWGCDKAIS